jgi:heme-degrading monooxygenase HmoA
MFASVRCYVVHKGPVSELVRRVQEDFAARIATRKGFVAYQLVDCGGGEIMTISVFREAEQAEASRKFARRWSEVKLDDLELTTTAALHGEMLISRVRPEMLAPRHDDADAPYATVRQYRLRRTDVHALAHSVAAPFADRVEGLDGFLAYLLLDCGGDELLSVSVFGDAAAAAASDELAREVAQHARGRFDIRRTDVVGGGRVRVAIATDGLLHPAPA